MRNFQVKHDGVTYDNEQKLISKLITDSIILSYKNNPLFKQTQILTTSVFRILTEMFINEKHIIFLDAPTGTGKSIIGYMVHFGFDYVKNYMVLYGLGNFDDDDNGAVDNDKSITTYTLTSSKMLQEQMDQDISRFSMEDNFAVLKGSSNYQCTLASEKTKTYVDYTNRDCKGMKPDAVRGLDCYEGCGYIQKRLQASESPSAIVNYAYYLTVMNANFSPYFAPRDLVIADEGHLVPQIVTGMYGVDITMFHLNKLVKLHNLIDLNFNKVLGDELKFIKTRLIYFHSFFEKDKNHKNIDSIIDFVSDFKTLCELFVKLPDVVKDLPISAAFNEMFKKELSDVEDKMITMSYEKNMEYLLSLSKRPLDILIESEEMGQITQVLGDSVISQRLYHKFKVRDLSEAEITQKYFLKHTKYVLFMSATIGDIHEFGNLLGLSESEFSGFNIPSSFDFSKSPIYLCNSGYLNYNSFQSKIDDVLHDTIKILKNHHPNDKGIIHTSTFTITNMLKERLYRQDKPNFNRYLFYTTSDEKEKCIQLLKTRKEPYVLIGPSLYEGIDLKDDQGRFNIIVKAPYAGIDNYTREKMKRYPFWYERETKEKLQQAIGRTNRHKDDWSKVYLMDSTLEKLVWKLPDYVTQRLKKFKV